MYFCLRMLEAIYFITSQVLIISKTEKHASKAEKEFRATFSHR